MTVKHLSKNKIQIEKVSERKGETDRDTGKAERERERYWGTPIARQAQEKEDSKRGIMIDKRSYI